MPVFTGEESPAKEPVSVIGRARLYLASMPPSISGQCGHNQLMTAASALITGFQLAREDARALLDEFNDRCLPPWSDRELEHKLNQAVQKPCDKPPGWLLGDAPGAGGAVRANGVSHRPPKPQPAPAPVAQKYVATADLPPLPEAEIEDGARKLIAAAFRPGEGVRVAHATVREDDAAEVPANRGLVLTREEWLRKLDERKGDPNRLYGKPGCEDQPGIFVSINPMKIGGAFDADVTAFRHALLEFDGISAEEQWVQIQASRLPCAAVIFSGGKSIHAWVKVEAKDRREYDERVKALHAHFAASNPDGKNINPSRFSRLPSCWRFGKRQKLLALDIGAESFSAWIGDKLADGVGKVSRPADLLKFNPDADASTVLGDRWLCRGGSCLIVGPSGVGKSSLAVQMATTWALGRELWGIKPARPLKSLIVQAENDEGDLAEMFQGVFAAFCDGWNDDEALGVVNQNLVFVRDSTHTGHAFTEALRRLIDVHKPDLVWFDPLLSFIGADISKQEVCSEFLRNWLNPISEATGVVWMCVHHTGKPPSDAKARSGWQGSDFAYAGIGSSELVNWARAALTLRQAGDVFELKLAKRGKRAKACHRDGQPTNSLWIKHSEGRVINWLQVDQPEEPAYDPEKGHKGGKKPDKPPGRPLIEFDYNLFYASIKGEGFAKLGELASRAMAFSGASRAHTYGKVIPILKERLKFNGKEWRLPE